MFLILVFILQLITGILSQGIFSPPEYTEATCSGSNQWTTWFDSGNPTITLGEFEITSHIQQIFSSFMCPVPVAIEARTTSDSNPGQTGDIFRFNPKDGFLCLNQQVDGFKQKLCSDYKVRYCCPSASIGQTTTTTTFQPPVVGGTCGRQTIPPSSVRIVGGAEAVPNSWPWMASLRINDHFCGGTLIDSRHVLTAAHCLTSVYPGSLRVVLGLHQRLNTNTGRTQMIGVQRIFMHEQYHPVTQAHDIAILRLCSPARLNEYVNLVCLPGPDPQEGQPVTAIGWGSTRKGSALPNALQQVTMQVTNAKAQQAYPAYFNAQRQIGAGVPYGGKDSCQGDSGGPLMYNNNGQWYVSGVVSFGRDCALSNYPGVYTRTSAYLNWIRNKINTP